jgi:hypothetical protein
VAFQTLKIALIQAPVLALSDFSKPFCIETDASTIGVGAVLMQDHHLIAYVSKALGPRLRGLSTYEKEYVAILLAVDHWRSYLQVGVFVIATDQQSWPILMSRDSIHLGSKKFLLSCLASTIRWFTRKGLIIEQLTPCPGTPTTL